MKNPNYSSRHIVNTLCQQTIIDSAIDKVNDNIIII